MDLNQKKTYFIPPKLNRSYEYAGFTIIELLIFLTLFIFSVVMATRGGQPVVLVLPALLIVLHWRILPGGKNVRQYLAMRWKYFKKEQAYSLQECGVRKK